jgi:predicted ATPase
MSVTSYPPLDLTPQKRKGKTLHAQLAQVEGLAVQQPVLMIWEDVHWRDPTTRESDATRIKRLLLDRRQRNLATSTMMNWAKYLRGEATQLRRLMPIRS